MGSLRAIYVGGTNRSGRPESLIPNPSYDDDGRGSTIVVDPIFSEAPLPISHENGFQRNFNCFPMRNPIWPECTTSNISKHDRPSDDLGLEKPVVLKTFQRKCATLPLKPVSGRE